MSYPVWPSALPRLPLRDGFSASSSPAVRTVEMESGAPRVTRVSSTTLHTATHSIVCTTEQLAEFDSFFDSAANAGADWVLIPMFTSNKAVPHKCRFVGGVQRVSMGRLWRVTFTLLTDEQHIDWGLT